MNTFIDIYCERLGPELWAEPLNALSNLAFFIAAFFAYRLARQRAALHANTFLLIIILIAIGAGSSLFHTFAQYWAMLADVIPILLFQIVFIVTYGRRMIGLNLLKNVCLLAGFFALTGLTNLLPQDLFNGSISYAPALIYLGGLGLYHWRTKKIEPFLLLIAFGTFLISLTFRSIDMMVCESFSYGIHYLWHILNGVVLYCCLRALIVNYAHR